jgi:predicted TIM-barrel fold metal-dependent hydrolase
VHVFDGAPNEARAGAHYEPGQHPLCAIEPLAAAHGVQHLVLVQPSVYGHDNRVLLRALAQRPGQHRGVVVVDREVTEGALDALHAAGVRGVRLNRVSPVGEQGDVAARFQALAPRLRARGWHCQWFVAPQHLAQVAALHQGSDVTCVLDHLGGLHANVDAHHEAWQAIQALAGQGAWVKLSGWYRLGATPPYAALYRNVQRLAGLFGERMVWGSDWPHTLFKSPDVPRYASTWQPVVDALGAAAAQALRQRQPALYV